MWTAPTQTGCGVLTGNQTGHKILQSVDAGVMARLDHRHHRRRTRGQSIHQRGTNGGVYIGTTNAVYYRNATMEDWELYNDGLPMINVHLPAGGITAAAYSDGGDPGVHQASFYEPSSVRAGFMVDRTRLNLATPCAADPIHVSAVSVVRCEEATYDWSIEGGQIVEANGPDVWVDFQESGTFDITLTVTDADEHQTHGPGWIWWRWWTNQ